MYSKCHLICLSVLLVSLGWLLDAILSAPVNLQIPTEPDLDQRLFAETNSFTTTDIKNTWKHCTPHHPDDLLSIFRLSIETERSSPLKDQIKIQGSASLTRQIIAEDNARVHIRVRMGENIYLFDKTVNLCESLTQVDRQCPLGETLEIKETMELSAPRLRYNIYLNATTGKGEPITCLEMDVGL